MEPPDSSGSTQYSKSDFLIQRGINILMHDSEKIDELVAALKSIGSHVKSPVNETVMVIQELSRSTRDHDGPMNRIYDSICAAQDARSEMASSAEPRKKSSKQLCAL